MTISEIRKSILEENPIANQNKINHPTKIIYTSKLLNGQRLVFALEKEKNLLPLKEQIESKLLIDYLTENI